MKAIWLLALFAGYAASQCTREGRSVCEPAIEAQLETCITAACRCKGYGDLIACFDSANCGRDSNVGQEYLEYVDQRAKACAN
jgi:hypothetical protein